MMKYFEDLVCMRVEIEVIGFVKSNPPHSLTGTKEENCDKLLSIVNRDRVDSDEVRLFMDNTLDYHKFMLYKHRSHEDITDSNNSILVTV